MCYIMIRNNINKNVQFRYVRTQSLKNIRVLEQNVLYKMQHKVFTYDSHINLSNRTSLVYFFNYSSCTKVARGSRSWAGD